jgi:hypothetical protein
MPMQGYRSSIDCPQEVRQKANLVGLGLGCNAILGMDNPIEEKVIAWPQGDGMGAPHTTDRHVKYWGRNDNGQLGLGGRGWR